MGMRRNWLTGEWEEFESGSLNGTWVHHEGEVKRADEVDWTPERKSSSAICAKKPWVSKSLAVPIEQAAHFQKIADERKTGARYVPDGKGYANLVCDSRGARNRELRSRGKADVQGGWGDYTGK